MRLPEPPPKVPWSAVERALRRTDLLAAFQRLCNQHYWSWDEASRHVPEGLDGGGAWQVMVLARSLTGLPMRRVDGGPFGWNQAAPSLLQLLLFAEARARDPFAAVRDAGREHLAEAILEEAYWSSRLEGAATTRVRALRMLRTGEPPRNRGERMILNNQRALDLVERRRTVPMSLDLLMRIHEAVTEGTLDDPRDAGRIQRPGERRVKVVDPRDGVVLHHPPPAEELPARLKALVALANDADPELPAVVRAVLLHFMLAHDHPFVDGNGRTARALYEWSLLRQGYGALRHASLSRVLAKAPAQYGRAFVHAEQTGDATYFILHQLRALRVALEAFTTDLERRMRRTQRALAGVKAAAGLNPRRRSILVQALARPSEEWTSTAVMRQFGVSRPAALSDLADLAMAGFLLEERRGRRRVWHPARDMAARLRGDR